jgi:hypothetical protein
MSTLDSFGLTKASEELISKDTKRTRKLLFFSPVLAMTLIWILERSDLNYELSWASLIPELSYFTFFASVGAIVGSLYLPTRPPYLCPKAEKGIKEFAIVLNIILIIGIYFFNVTDHYFFIILILIGGSMGGALTGAWAVHYWYNNKIKKHTSITEV